MIEATARQRGALGQPHESGARSRNLTRSRGAHRRRVAHLDREPLSGCALNAEVDLRVEGAPGQGLTIEVRNPTPVGAAGASKIPGSGTGLVGLAERAALTGGRVDHGFDRRGDFYLRAWLPWA